MKRSIFALLFGLLASPALAETYQCAILQHTSNGGWLADTVAVSLSKDRETATVNDPLIIEFKKTPIEAEVVADNDKRLTVAWRLKVKNGRNQHANMEYRLTIRQPSLSATMSAQPLSYDNQFRAEGSCKKIKG